MLTPEERLKRQREGGRKGGKKKVPKGFAKNKDLASEAGKKGAESRWAKETETTL